LTAPTLSPWPGVPSWRPAFARSEEVLINPQSVVANNQPLTKGDYP